MRVATRCFPANDLAMLGATECNAASHEAAVQPYSLHVCHTVAVRHRVLLLSARLSIHTTSHPTARMQPCAELDRHMKDLQACWAVDDASSRSRCHCQPPEQCLRLRRSQNISGLRLLLLSCSGSSDVRFNRWVPLHPLDAVFLKLEMHRGRLLRFACCVPGLT